MSKKTVSPDAVTGTTTAKQERYEKKTAKYAANKARREQKTDSRQKNETCRVGSVKCNSFAEMEKYFDEMYGRTVSTGETTIGGKKVGYIRISSPVEVVRNINSFSELFDWVNQYYYYEYSRMCDVAKIYSEESLDLNPCFTFAIDMLTQLWDRNPEKGLESYIKRMVKQYCKKEIQGYFEMALSLSIMVEVFTYKNIPELCKVCKKWYNDLLYSEEYKNYVSKDQNINVRCILN